MDEPTLAVWHMLNIGKGFMYCTHKLNWEQWKDTRTWRHPLSSLPTWSPCPDPVYNAATASTMSQGDVSTEARRETAVL